jgi:hypothetical protein
MRMQRNLREWYGTTAQKGAEVHYATYRGEFILPDPLSPISPQTQRFIGPSDCKWQQGGQGLYFRG